MRLLVILFLLVFLLVVFAVRRAARTASSTPAGSPPGAFHLQARLLAPASWTSSHLVASAGSSAPPLFLAESRSADVRGGLRTTGASTFDVLVSWRGSGPAQKVETFLSRDGAAAPALVFHLAIDDPSADCHKTCIVGLSDDPHESAVLIATHGQGRFAATKDRLPPADTIVTITLQRKQEA